MKSVCKVPVAKDAGPRFSIKLPMPFTRIIQSDFDVGIMILIHPISNKVREDSKE